MNKPIQDRITIDRVKIAAFLSEETLAFTARVLLDGVPFAQAHNAGHGGNTEIRALTGALHFATNTKAHSIYESARAYCKELPGYSFTLNDKEIQCTWNLDDVVDHLAADYEFEKKIRAGFSRMMRNYVAYENGGAIYQIKRRKDYGPANIAAIEQSVLAKHPQARMLSLLPTDTAYALYKTICVKE